MRVRQADLTHGKLESFGVRATQFLCKRDFRSLTKWLPYAVAYDRDHAEAIRDDLSSWLRPGDHVLAESLAEYRVKYFASERLLIKVPSRKEHGAKRKRDKQDKSGGREFSKALRLCAEKAD